MVLSLVEVQYSDAYCFGKGINADDTGVGGFCAYEYIYVHLYGVFSVSYICSLF